MRGRRWLVAAMALSMLAGACGSTAVPSTAPGSSSAPGSSLDPSTAPAGSESPAVALFDRLGDPATATSAAAAARAEIRELRGIADSLGPDGPATIAALDALELRLVQAAADDVRSTLDGDTATARLVSYVPPRPGDTVPNANILTTALVGIFVEPMIEKAMDSGKTSFSFTKTESEPAGSTPHKENGTFTWNVNYAGGLLTAGFDGTYSAKTGEPPDVGTVTETVSMSFTVKPCPDASGKVALELVYAEDSLTAGTKVNTHSTLKATLHAVMNVNDDAELVGTDVTSESEGSIGQTTSEGVVTEGGASATMTFGLSGAGAMSTPDVTAATGEGDAESARGSQTMGILTAAFLGQAVASASSVARKGWRGGKCVELVDVTPDSKEVGQREQVDVTAKLKHRVTDEELKKKVKATVQGAGQIEPAEADGPKVQYVYTAGEHFGDSGTVELRSVSNRGIASTTRTFTIRGKWTLAASGNYTQTLGAAAGGFTFGADLKVTVDPFALAVDDTGRISGTGTVHFSGKPISPPSAPCTGSYESTETLKVEGVQENPTDGPRLKLTLSAPPGTVKSSITCPGGIGGSTQFNMAGGFGGNLFNNTVSEVVLPAGGGKVPVDQKGTSSVWTTHAVLTFELIVPEGAP